jgi:hypothetical protein
MSLTVLQTASRQATTESGPPRLLFLRPHWHCKRLPQNETNACCSQCRGSVNTRLRVKGRRRRTCWLRRRPLAAAAAAGTGLGVGVSGEEGCEKGRSVCACQRETHLLALAPHGAMPKRSLGADARGAGLAGGRGRRRRAGGRGHLLWLREGPAPGPSRRLTERGCCWCRPTGRKPLAKLLSLAVPSLFRPPRARPAVLTGR